MNKEKLEAKILDFAIEEARNPFPKNIGFNQNRILIGNDIFDTVENALMKTGIETTYENGGPEVKNAGRASAFAASVICHLYISDKIRKSIDKFADDPKNAQFFSEFNSEDEKKAFIGELKNMASSRLAVQPETIYGKDFAQRITDKFHEYVKSDKDPAEHFLGDGLGAVIMLNEQLAKKHDVDEAISAVRDEYKYTERQFGFTHSLENLIFDQIKENSSHLSEEKGGMFSDTLMYAIDLTPENKAEIKSFIQHYKTNSLTPEDKQWASESFFCPVLHNTDELIINGKTKFTAEQIKEMDDKDVTAEVIGALLTGKKVTCKDYENGTNEKLYLEKFDPNDPAAGFRPKSFLDKLVDFFKQLLGYNIQPTLAKENNAENERTREKLSFDELSGIKNIKNVKSPSAAKTELSSEKKSPSKGNN